MVVGVRHRHAILHPFVIFPAMKLAPLILGPGIRARSGLPDIIKFPCRRNGRFVRICGRSIGHTAIRVAWDLLFLGTLLFKGHGQSNHNLVVICTLIVPLAGRIVVCVQVYHIIEEGAGVEI